MTDLLNRDKPTETEPLLRAEQLEFAYDSGIRLRVNHLELAAGEFVGILGPNGAGKSTCLRLLAGLTTPSSGVVYMCGHPVEKLSPRERARYAAWVPQRTETPFEWTVIEMVSMGRHPFLGTRLRDRQADRDAVRTALDRVGLRALETRPVGTLSGGEWQRALIARALAQEAQILLLDEPVASLDLGYQRQIYQLVRDLCRDRGVSAIAADHHVDLQGAFCDRLVLMNHGAVVAEGAPEDVLRREHLEPVYRTPLRVVIDEATGRPSVRWRFDAEVERP